MSNWPHSILETPIVFSTLFMKVCAQSSVVRMIAPVWWSKDTPFLLISLCRLVQLNIMCRGPLMTQLFDGERDVLLS